MLGISSKNNQPPIQASALVKALRRSRTRLPLLVEVPLNQIDSAEIEQAGPGLDSEKPVQERGVR
jgi:hypothetical protein